MKSITASFVLSLSGASYMMAASWIAVTGSALTIVPLFVVGIIILWASTHLLNSSWTNPTWPAVITAMGLVTIIIVVSSIVVSASSYSYYYSIAYYLLPVAQLPGPILALVGGIAGLVASTGINHKLQSQLGQSATDGTR